MQTASTDSIAITNVRVFDGHRILDPSTVLIENGRFGDATITTALKTLDGQGAVLLPGLIDAHVHLRGRECLEQLARYGVTTALDMAIWPLELQKSLRDQEGLTDIRACGIPATAPGSTHSRNLPLPEEAILSSADQANQFVLNRVKEGADYIKVVADIPGPDQATLDAIVKASHQHGKKVVAHAVTVAATAMAQASGVDFVTHAPLDGLMDDEAVDHMLSSKRIDVPTLTMMKKVAQVKGSKYDAARENVAIMYRAGVPILAGTDANTAPGSPAQVPHGISLHEELELLTECGMSTVDVLQSATSLPAKYFDLHDRGVVQPGYRADFILVKGNPIEDIRETRNIQTVWIAGKEYIDKKGD